ncbi:MAG: LLM class F420-dependent oxidoreductase, partial [Mycobacterium sp.]|nr:LLM class F420-dependent oxidoreductase [Mycobacterium sp.]
AGGGEKVTLKIAAKYAHYTNFTSEPDGFAQKSQILAEHCREVGTDYGAIVRSANVNAVLGSTEGDVEQRIGRVRDRLAGIAGEGAADAMMSMFSAPGSAAGTAEQVIENLIKLRDLGCDYVICYFPEAAYDRSGIELFEREVISALA